MAPKDRGPVPLRSKTAEERVVAADQFLVDRYETDSVPAHWVELCNDASLVEEVWVPTRFNALTFAQAGVSPDRLHVSRHDIAAIWVAFFSRCQRYRC